MALLFVVGAEGVCSISGLSTDIKPDPTSSFTFYETDTAKNFIANGIAWNEVLNPVYQVSSVISSAAFRDSSYFSISSVVVSHVALSDPHTQYQLESGLSSAAYTLATDYALSTHALGHITGGADLVPVYTTTSTGLAPLSLGSTASFLRGDGLWTTPPGGAPSAHASTHITGGSDIIANFSNTSSGLVPLSGGGTTNFLRADGTFVAPSGGSDPWTYVKVSTNHFGTSSVAFRDIPGLTFTPGTNSSYEFEAALMLKTSTVAVNPAIKVRWPTNTSSVIWMNLAQTNSSGTVAYGNQTSTFNTVIAGALATSTACWPCILGGVINTFGGTASSFSLMLATESTTVFVSTMINSFLKYRTY